MPSVYRLLRCTFRTDTLFPLQNLPDSTKFQRICVPCQRYPRSLRVHRNCFQLATLSQAIPLSSRPHKIVHPTAPSPCRPRLADVIRRLEQQLPGRMIALQKSRALAAARAARGGSLSNGPSVGTNGLSNGMDGLSGGSANPDANVQGLLSLSFSKVAGGDALIVRFAAGSTDAAYAFLREQLESLTGQLGSRPYPA